MNTKELRAYIDRLLGNSLRCLLPSYWWKRAFNVTADAIDNLAADTQGKIEKVQQGVDELKEKRVLYADNPQDHKEENLALLNILWGEYVLGRGHDPVYLVTEDGEMLTPNFNVQSNHIYFYNVPRHNNEGTTRQKLYTYHFYDKAGGEVVIEISDSFEHYVNQSSKNAVQSSAVYTAMQAKQDKLVSGSNIKTLNGKSILGSGDVQFAFASQDDIDLSRAMEKLLDERTMEQGNDIIDLKYGKQDKLESGANIKTINGVSLMGSGDIQVTEEGVVDLSGVEEDIDYLYLYLEMLEEEIEWVEEDLYYNISPYMWFDTAAKTSLDDITNFDIGWITASTTRKELNSRFEDMEGWYIVKLDNNIKFFGSSTSSVGKTVRESDLPFVFKPSAHSYKYYEGGTAYLMHPLVYKVYKQGEMIAALEARIAELENK